MVNSLVVVFILGSHEVQSDLYSLVKSTVDQVPCWYCNLFLFTESAADA